MYAFVDSDNVDTQIKMLISKSVGTMRSGNIFIRNAQRSTE